MQLALSPSETNSRHMRQPTIIKDFVRVSNRMIEWSPAADLPKLRELAPKNGEKSVGDHNVADEMCRLVKALIDGHPVDVGRLRELELKSLRRPPTETVPTTQVGACVPPSEKPADEMP